MGLTGKLEVEVETKSSAEKFWEGIRDSTQLFPKIFPDQFKSIETVQGDGKSAGSVRLIKYGEGVPFITFVKEKLEVADDDNKLVAYSVVDGDLAKFYANFKATFQVVPKGGQGGALVKWSVEYEKVNEEVPEPTVFMESAVKTFNDFDAYLLKNN